MRISINAHTLIQTDSDECHQVTINFMTPIILFGATDYDWAAEEFQSWALLANTSLVFRRYQSGTYNYLTVQVLGFGVGVSSQNGY